LLAGSSDRGTIHIFKVLPPNQRVATNKSSNVVSSFFNDTAKAFATFKVTDENTKVGFTADSKSLIVISQQGKFYEVAITPAGGELKNPIEKNMISP